MSPIVAIAFRKNQLGRLRSDFPEIAKGTGVYFLIGPEKTKDHKLTAYIGESENIGKRLSDHLSRRNHRQSRNWTDTVLVARNDGKFTVAHGRYAESRLIRNVPHSSRWRLINNQVPAENAGSIGSSDIPGMNKFVLQTQTLVGCFGWDLFRNFYDLTQQTASEDHEGQVVQSPGTPKFIVRGGGYYAEMVIDTSGNFVVLKGSKARIRETNTLQDTYRRTRKSFITDRTFEERDGEFVFTRNCSFPTVSAAAAVVKGMSETGRTAWKVEGEQTTYAEWEKSQGE